MSLNVITPIQFKRIETTKKVQNVKLLPNLFTNLLKQYKAKQNKLKQKKIDFLTKEAYRYFYNLLEIPKLADVDLPEFLYEKQRRQLAYDYAHKALVDVIADGRLNECYTKRMKEIKNRG